MKKMFVVLLVIISVVATSCSNAENIEGNEQNVENTEKSGIVQSEAAVYTKEEYDQVVKERDQYKSELETEKSNLKKEKENSDRIQKEYEQYHEKMKAFENLSEAEAEARLIEANRTIEEEEKAKQEAAEEAKRLEEEKDKMGYDTGITYENLARTPDDYAYEKVKFSGKVVQTLESDSEVDMRLAVDGDYNQMIYVVYDPSIVSMRILEGDSITIYGWFYDLYSYDSTLGAKITLPLVWVDRIELSDGVITSVTNGKEVTVSSKDYISSHASEIVNSLNITEYELPSSWYYYTYFLIDNLTEYDLKISVDVTYYDKNNKLVGIDSESVECVEKGTTAYIKCHTDEKYDHYEYSVSVDNPSDWYQAATSSVTYEVSETSKKVIITAQNNSSSKLSAKAYVLFFDGKGKLVDADEVYLNDDDFEFKPGHKLNKEAKTYETYKSYRIIIYATVDTW